MAPGTGLRIATWNINSVRLRIDIVRQFLATYAPDILCLQETKVQDDLFPVQAFEDMGYPHLAIHGQKMYHGVAIVARRPFVDQVQRHWCGKTDARHLYVTLDGGIELHNFYIPSGGDVPDPEANDKFAHKLQFMGEMADWFGGRTAPDNKMIMVGDFNVAPLETDVWSHKQLLDVVSHTPIEVETLARVQASHDWTDAVRHLAGDEAKLYSWWSYRARDWAASDRGRRLDHIWLTPAMVPALKSAEILKPVRGWERPSDHAPVIADFAG